MTEPGIAIYRFSAPLFYANAARFAEDIRDLVGAVPSPVRWLVVDAEAITNLDYSAARTVRRLHQDLLSNGTVLAFARVGPSLQSDMLRHGLVDVIGQAQIFLRLHDALASFAKFKQQAKP
jgi:MFS superfamily sulfate permease-like transporter